MTKVVVASTNPAKIEAVKQGFLAYFSESELECIGVSTESNVAAQPMSEEETRMGANNRAQNAKIAASDAQYWVGVEGGIAEYDSHLYTFAWICILDNDGKKSQGRSASFRIALPVEKLVRSGMELGYADDQVFGTQNSKNTNGAVGLLTDDRITRSDLYSPAVILALAPLQKPEIYS